MISASTCCPQRPGDRARDEQDDDEGIREELEQLNEGREAADRNGLIRAVRGETPGCLNAAKS